MTITKQNTRLYQGENWSISTTLLLRVFNDLSLSHIWIKCSESIFIIKHISIVSFSFLFFRSQVFGIKVEDPIAMVRCFLKVVFKNPHARPKQQQNHIVCVVRGICLAVAFPCTVAIVLEYPTFLTVYLLLGWATSSTSDVFHWSTTN